MPMARMTMDNFWSLGDPRPADLLAEHLGLEDGAPEPVAPTVDIRVRRGAASGPDDTLLAARGRAVVADVTGQYFGEVFSWTLLTKPPGSAAEIVGRDRQIASFTPDVPGDYTLAISVAGLGGTRTGDQVSLSYTIRDDNGDTSTATVAFNVLPTVTYGALYDNIFNTDCVTCHTSGDLSTPFDFDSRSASVGEVQSRLSAIDPDCSLILLKPSAQTVSPCGGSITRHTGPLSGFDYTAGCASGDFSPEGSCRYDGVLRWIREGGLDN